MSSRRPNSQSPIQLTGQDPSWLQRQRKRESLKIVGLLALSAFILILAFLRFSRTIPWSAR